LSNVLRVIAYENVEQVPAQDRVALLAFEIDDQTPEDLAIGLDRLRAHPAVLDVLQAPAFGKKGRMVVHVQVLAQPEAVDDVAGVCFSETATLGLRWQVVERRVLPRRQHSAESGGRMLRVKLTERLGVPTAKVESDDLINVSGSREGRENVRRTAEAAVVKMSQAEGSNSDG
jgi:uncharacterized protein (DUF111 family)